MNNLTILSPHPLPLKPSPLFPFSSTLLQTLTFCRPKPLKFKLLSFKSSPSPLPLDSHLSDADEQELFDDEDDEDDDDGEEAAEEYDYFSGETSDNEIIEDNETETLSKNWHANDKETKSQRVEKIRTEVKAYGNDIIDVHELASIYDFRIDKFQRLAIEAFLKGSSVVVSAPTSSGKTLIAEAAAVATVARGRRIFYTTPLKALSNQKFRDFRETFGEENVGLLTGDSSVNKDAQILIMTTEILRNMLYQSIGMASSGSGLFHVDVIVLDEVHFLSDISRGTVWEEIVIYCPKKVQLICLSATVKNPEELAGWINEVHGKTELVTSSKRPVPLTWHFSRKSSLIPLLDEKGKHMNRKLSLNYLQLSASGAKSYKDDGPRRRNLKKRGSNMRFNSIASMSEEPLSKNDIGRIRRSLVPQIVDTLAQLKVRDMLPAVWFIFNRRGCDAAVQYLDGIKLLDECETREVELALKRFSIQNPDAVRENAVKGLLKGVSAHHAGCLPLWKSFTEELFQRGLIKVVFATETLAAGINMPARTAVISALSKRSSTGRIQLTPNELLQMAGRAGRRGIDERGHVVLVQAPNEGAEEGCKILFAGLEPLVSQFTASYGMVLNLLAGAKVTRISNESDTRKVLQAGRTLEEARKLVEQSFGTYIGSNVMLASKEELAGTRKEIEKLLSEISDEAIDRKSKRTLSEEAYKEIAGLQEQLREEKRLRTELRRTMEAKRLSAIKLLLERGNDHLPFLCLQYKDPEGIEHSVPAVYLGKADSFDGSNLKNMVAVIDSSATNAIAEVETMEDLEPSYYVALGSDNSWYLFTEKWVKTIYKTGFPNVALAQGDVLPHEVMWKLLDKEERQWEMLADSELGGLWYMEGSLDTWSWSLNVPVLNSLSDDDEELHTSQAYHDAVEHYKGQRTKVARLKKTIARTEGFREYKKILDWKSFTQDKINRLKFRSNRLMNRIEEIEPSGWKEFLKISSVVHEIRALDINTQVIFPLGETAAAIRGENELWLAMVLRNRILLGLKPAQLAAVCASVVSEGIKVRAWENNSYIYEPSSEVVNIVRKLEEQRSSLMQLQEKHGVERSCYLDSHFSGMVEAWASGLTWREIMMDCAMDEGDLARLLRRTIDLLAQIPKLPDIDPILQTNAKAASDIMDRPPISELSG
ncbi:DExH-box ATP-dependent RNA helicase DExH15 chloroplastic [Mercurialis annua]|uniref:DExH-box ATP-dependent RNA helicase DExH15 chloroplastic n=1 Tax=Mercurialis annua TaxID=3986 RepID=UPI00215E8BD1|nr:DExH-box ATP-dependent RNA helicase DExH15 chloroplastic [Mercurialis annua]